MASPRRIVILGAELLLAAASCWLFSLIGAALIAGSAGCGPSIAITFQAAPVPYPHRLSSYSLERIERLTGPPGAGQTMTVVGTVLGYTTARVDSRDVSPEGREDPTLTAKVREEARQRGCHAISFFVRGPFPCPDPRHCGTKRVHEYMASCIAYR
jgi:hypothetical protein